MCNFREVTAEERNGTRLCGAVRSVSGRNSVVTCDEPIGKRLCATFHIVTGRCIEVTGHESNGMRLCPTVLTVSVPICGEATVEDRRRIKLRATVRGVVGRCNEVNGEDSSGLRLGATAGTSYVDAMRLPVRNAVGRGSVLQTECRESYFQ